MEGSICVDLGHEAIAKQVKIVLFANRDSRLSVNVGNEGPEEVDVHRAE